MKKIIITGCFVVIFTISLFAGVGFEFALNPLANSMDNGIRAGVNGGITYNSDDSKLLINIANVNALIPVETETEEIVMNFSSGILYSFVEPLYAGLRIGFRGCPEGNFDPDPQIYNSIVLRAQKLKKGLTYFVETEISIAGNNNKLSLGLSYKF